MRDQLTSMITDNNNVPWKDRDEWQRKARPWTVELRYQGRTYTFPFYTGRLAGEPTTFDAAYCILSDASGFENSRGFEDWAGDYGYDTDSRAAERIYLAVRRAHHNVKRLLGDDFDDLIYMDEDDLQSRCE
jgi:hypothetical protein